MTQRIFTFAIISLFLLTYPPPAKSAEEIPKASPSILDPNSEEEPNKQHAPYNYRLDKITVTATKTETAAELLPVTSYTVDQHDIEAQPNYFMSNFGELIRDVPGVHVSQYYPWGPPWVHFRGTGYFPAPEWGVMLQESRLYMVRAPWLLLGPGISVTMTVLGFNLLAEGLRDAFQVKEAGVF